MRRLALIALVAFAATGSAGSTPEAGVSTPIVYGYLYAGHCPGAGIADVVDRWGLYECNCTSYVAWALTANNQRTDWFIRGAMDAWNWPHVAQLAGLEVDRNASVGAVAVWPSIAPPFGHVAYVMGVGARSTIDVAEYNFPSPSGGQTFGFATRTNVADDDAMFIHVPAGPLSARRVAGPFR